MADDVQVRFGAQLDGLIAGINEAKEELETITAPIEGIRSAFAGLAEVAAAAFAVDQVSEAMSKYAEYGESIARISAITGASFAQVQLFGLAIKLSGGDAETASATLNILQKNIGDAISTTGPARTAFENMGFSLEQLKNTDVVDLLFQIKERMDEAGNSAEQSALKQDYLRTVAGRGAAGFLALRMSLEDVKKIAEETGVVMDPRMVSQADHLAESGKKLSSAWQGLGQTIASEVTPAYDRLLSVMTGMVEVTNRLISGTSHIHLGPLGMPHAPGWAQGAPSATPSPGSEQAGPTGMPLGEGQFGPTQQQNVPSNPLPALDKSKGTVGGDDDDHTEEQIDRNDLQTTLEIEKLKLQSKKDADQAAVESVQMSSAQQIADLREVAAQEYALDVQAVDQLAETYDSDSAEFAALQNKKLVLAQEYQNQLAKLSEQAAAAQKKQYEAELAPWKQLMGDMGAAADTMINGILSGTQTWKQAFDRSFDDLGIKFAEVMTKMTAEYLAFEATSGKGILGFGTSNPFAAIGGSAAGAVGGGAGGAANTATTALTTAITGNTASTAQNTTSILQQFESMLQSVAQTLGLTTATAASTTATTASATAATAQATATTGLIPSIAANVAALGTNTAALIASKALPSYDVGSWSIPNDQVAMVHAGEMIIPASQAEQIRSGSASLGSGGGVVGSGAAGGGGNFTINVNAIDTQTGAQFLKSNASVIAQTLAVQMRNGNTSLMSAARN